MANTEKPKPKEEMKKQQEENKMQKQISSPKKQPNLGSKPNKKKDLDKGQEIKKETEQKQENKNEGEKNASSEGKPKKIQKVKKTFAVVNGKSLPISSKYSKDICKFIKNKKIEDAIKDLEEVMKGKKPLPMRGEYGHKKGIERGKYPKKSTVYFIKLLKSLSANCVVNGLEDPFVSEAISNIASRPLGKFGRWKRKRTHVKIIAKDKKRNEKSKNKVEGEKK